MQKSPGKKAKSEQPCRVVPNFSRPVWGNVNMSCEDCNFNDQDIDTFPCAKCHTRH